MQILDLETKLDQLVSENRLLQNAKNRAERGLEDAAQDRSRQKTEYDEAAKTRDVWIGHKDEELSELRQMINGLKEEVSQLREVNEGLSATHAGVDEEHRQRYKQLEEEHAHAHEQWQQSTRDLDELRNQHTSVSTGMEEIVSREVATAVAEKDVELRRLQSELQATRQQVMDLQRQILATRGSDDSMTARDEDYFETQCSQLCQHIQQWVVRFSKFSDNRACYLASEIRDEKILDRFENAILDGTDVDTYLADRVKRRDVFMAVMMKMVWEYIFLRYLFGMDREQRQKLKNLEKLLSEVGSLAAVNRWRSTTLTLLSKRDAFKAQRVKDTEAVVQEIYETLATFLPPPLHLVDTIQESLRKVMAAAVDLSIEMRTQRSEYTMLPPLEPEYDTNGDLVRKIPFNTAVMKERGASASANDELQARGAVVRMVLFPLIAKRGDDDGVGDTKVIVCPAVVLTAPATKDKKSVRVMSAQGRRSEASFAGSNVDMGNMF